MLGPAILQSAFDCMLRYSYCGSPLWYAHRAAIDGQTYCVSAIERLFVTWDPLAVLRTVVAIYVYALKRVAIWAFSQVFNELRKSVWPTPFVAYRNTTAAIIRIVFSTRIMAAAQHVSINAICPRLRHAMHLWHSACVSPQAAATLCVAGLQIGSKNRLDCAAIAATFPYLDASVRFANIAKYYEATEAFSFVVFESLAGWLRLVVSHDETLLDRVALRLEPAGVPAPVRLASLYGACVTQP